MILIEVHRFGLSRTLVLVGLFAIGLIASTAVRALGSSNTWTPTGSMTTARSGDTAILLANGEVLVAGGGNATGSLTSVELYNPATGKWTATGRKTTARASHTATLLPNGEVLVAGGVSNGSSPWAPSCPQAPSSTTRPLANGRPRAA